VSINNNKSTSVECVCVCCVTDAAAAASFTTTTSERKKSVVVVVRFPFSLARFAAIIIDCVFILFMSYHSYFEVQDWVVGSTVRVVVIVVRSVVPVERC
jgi:hypothetical protein